MKKLIQEMCLQNIGARNVVPASGACALAQIKEPCTNLFLFLVPFLGIITRYSSDGCDVADDGKSRRDKEPSRFSNDLHATANGEVLGEGQVQLVSSLMDQGR